MNIPLFQYISVNICFFSKGEDGTVDIVPSSPLLNKAVKRTGNSNKIVHLRERLSSSKMCESCESGYMGCTGLMQMDTWDTIESDWRE